MSGTAWFLVLVAAGLAGAVACLGLRRRAAPPPAQADAPPIEPARLHYPEELHQRIAEMRNELGPDTLPALLHAAISDLDRHLTVFDTVDDPQDETRRRALHSFIGILDTVGCSSLAERCRQLQDRHHSGDQAPQQQAEILEQVRLLRAEILDLLSRDFQGAAAPQSGET
ncbi:hypothetical protein [Paracoccus homiensis]|uniref:hypothetical protein n=1 Tax=Paracoccus homiensis TaxID=364199 RepID=UPI00398CDE56